MRFKIGRVKIKISFLFFALLTMFFIVDKGGLALVTLSCVALHETGHILALICFGNAPEEIAFGIFGVRIRQNKYALSQFKQAVVVLCGPLVNIILFALSLAAFYACRSQFFLTISAVNLVMGGFNLLPIFPLDGGQILMIILNLFFAENTVCRIMRTICIVMLFALISAGVFLVAKTGFNVSLLATGAYLCLMCIKSIRIRY